MAVSCIKKLLAISSQLLNTCQSQNQMWLDVVALRHWSTATTGIDLTPQSGHKKGGDRGWCFHEGISLPLHIWPFLTVSHYLCFLRTHEHMTCWFRSPPSSWSIIIIILIMIVLINMAMTLADSAFVLSREKGAWLCCCLIKRQTSKTKIFGDEEQD